MTVLRERYLLHDEQGRPAESTGELMDRSARCVAAAEDQYEPGSSRRWAERFATLLRNLEFLPNSPTLMNSGTDLGLLAGCFVLPIEDSLQSIFATLGQAAELQRAGGGTGYAFSHLRPAGDRVASTGGTASGPVSFYGCMTVPRVWSPWAVAGVAPVWLCLMCRTRISVISSPPRPNPQRAPAFQPIGWCDRRVPAGRRTQRPTPAGQSANRQDRRADARRRAVRRHLQSRARRWRSRAGVSRHDQ